MKNYTLLYLYLFIYPEYIQHGGCDTLCTLHKIVTWVWEEEVVPEEWHQGIIISLYDISYVAI